MFNPNGWTNRLTATVYEFMFKCYLLKGILCCFKQMDIELLVLLLSEYQEIYIRKNFNTNIPMVQ